MRSFVRRSAGDSPAADRRIVASAVHLLGLDEVTSDRVILAHRERLDGVAAAWPFALAVQALAATWIVGGALVDGQPAVATMAAIHAGFLLLLSLIGWAILAHPLARARPAHLRTRAFALATSGIAAALLSLLWTTTQIAGDGAHFGGFVVAAGAVGVTAVALHPVRAAILGFAGGLVLMLALLSQAMIATALALVILVGLIVATLRLAQVDAATLRLRAQGEEQGRLATRMIAEFEAHGAGWFWQTDRSGRICYLSAKVAGELAAEGRDPLGRMLTDMFRMDSVAPGTERTLAFHLSSRTSFSDYTVCAAWEEQPERWWSISGRPVVDDLGRFQGFIGSGSDLTEQRRSEAEITRLALFDSLTGLANRQRMRHSLDKTLQQQVGPYRPASLFLMDLDRFKAVNDTLGHQAGDDLLKQVAQRLQRGVGDAGLVGRLGGDEFQVLLPGIDNRETLATLARELIAALSQPYFVSDTSVTIGCSIGIAIAPRHGEDAEELIRNADLALYAAKADGRGVHRFFSDEMLAGARTRKQLEDDIRAALAGGGFHLVYQPVVSTLTQDIVAYEALLRWHHPTRGAVSPSEFIPVAEECGLVEPLGEWVLRTACRDAATWPRAARVAVNVSPIQFANPAFPALVASALAHADLAPRRLELEITEGVFLDGSQSTDTMFKALKGLGVRLALDDFGTGYSSLGYLRSAPFDKIKIDQSFVRGAAQPGTRNAAIIKAIVTLADTLGMETTAEGVEIQDEIALIRTLGCSHIQGFVYGGGVDTATVCAQLASGQLIPVGHKVSRAPRAKVLRSARIAIGGSEGDVRIRNISSTGALVDGLTIDGEGIGLDVLIELVEDQMFAANVAWASDGRAGLRFVHPFDLERFNQPVARALRRSA